MPLRRKFLYNINELLLVIPYLPYELYYMQKLISPCCSFSSYGIHNTGESGDLAAAKKKDKNPVDMFISGKALCALFTN